MPVCLLPCGRQHFGSVGGGLLSWGCQNSPLHRHQRLVSTPGSAAAPKSCFPVSPRGVPPFSASAPSARRCHTPDSFRPCRSSRLRRLSPPGTFQVCCTLKPIMGFTTFPAAGSFSRLHPSLAPISRRLRRALPGHSEEAQACRQSSRGRSGSEEPSRKSWGAWKRVRFPLAFPCGVLPFGAFPSTTAVKRHLRLRVTLRPLVHARKTENVQARGGVG